MSWAENYIGIPFGKNGNTRESLDCWRLVVLVYHEKLGVELPDYSGIFVDDSLTSLIKVTRKIREEKQKWECVDKPQTYDVILLRTGNMVYHTGIVIDQKRMLHTMEGINSTIEEYKSLQWKDKVEGFYHYGKQTNHS
jgi:cell wall-associated NlpC family hydrolase